MQEREQQPTNTTFTIAAPLRQGAECKRYGRAQYKSNWSDHSQDHVGDHVKRKRKVRINTETAAGRVIRDSYTDCKRDSATNRPLVAAPRHQQDAANVKRGR